MASYRLLRTLLIIAALASIAGCVLSVMPLSKPTSATSSAVTPQPAQEDHHNRRYYRCRAGVKPLPGDDRPKLGDVAALDPAKLNVALAAHIHQLDQYLTARQHKEEVAYRAWRTACDGFPD